MRTTGTRRDTHHGHFAGHSSTCTSRPRTKVLRTQSRSELTAHEPRIVRAPELVDNDWYICTVRTRAGSFESLLIIRKPTFPVWPWDVGLRMMRSVLFPLPDMFWNKKYARTKQASYYSTFSLFSPFIIPVVVCCIPVHQHNIRQEQCQSRFSSSSRPLVAEDPQAANLRLPLSITSRPPAKKSRLLSEVMIDGYIAVVTMCATRGRFS